MDKIRIIGRSSALSLLQMEKVRDKITARFPQLQVELLPRSSRGDAMPDIPLHTVEGSDFFTKEIFEALENREADIAVHSLKDMSSAHFFGDHVFAIPDRADTRDVLFLHPDFREKLQKGAPLIIGTCSPRREEMAVGFLKSILSLNYPNVNIKVRPIRGNVDTRLRKLATGEYDATILAAAGVNRMLLNKTSSTLLRPSLEGMQWIFLPLIECTPAPCQGAIVAEALPRDQAVIEILNAINEPALLKACKAEKQLGRQFGTGCIQRFGITSFYNDDKLNLYAGGQDENGTSLDKWYGLPDAIDKNLKLFSSTDYMGSFFDYDFLDYPDYDSSHSTIYFVANYKAVHNQAIADFLKQKRVWVAGTKTWRELAKWGIWVEGSADALGVETLNHTWQSPLVNISKSDITILTHEHGAENWRNKGYNALATYRLKAEVKPFLAEKIVEADFIFWTSAEQFRLYSGYAKADAQHSCSSGETAIQLKNAGLAPLIFPTIKAFQQWRNSSIQ